MGEEPETNDTGIVSDESVAGNEETGDEVIEGESSEAEETGEEPEKSRKLYMGVYESPEEMERGEMDYRRRMNDELKSVKQEIDLLRQGERKGEDPDQQLFNFLYYDRLEEMRELHGEIDDEDTIRRRAIRAANRDFKNELRRKQEIQDVVFSMSPEKSVIDGMAKEMPELRDLLRNPAARQAVLVIAREAQNRQKNTEPPKEKVARQSGDKKMAGKGGGKGAHTKAGNRGVNEAEIQNLRGILGRNPSEDDIKSYLRGKGGGVYHVR